MLSAGVVMRAAAKLVVELVLLVRNSPSFLEIVSFVLLVTFKILLLLRVVVV